MSEESGALIITALLYEEETRVRMGGASVLDRGCCGFGAVTSQRARAYGLEMPALHFPVLGSYSRLAGGAAWRTARGWLKRGVKRAAADWLKMLPIDLS